MRLNLNVKLRVRLLVIRLLTKIRITPPIHYVGSSEVLPPPLTADEESELLNKLRQGDMQVKFL